jgi:hypothetical protein
MVAASLAVNNAEELWALLWCFGAGMAGALMTYLKTSYGNHNTKSYEKK